MGPDAEYGKAIGIAIAKHRHLREALIELEKLNLSHKYKHYIKLEDYNAAVSAVLTPVRGQFRFQSDLNSLMKNFYNLTHDIWLACINRRVEIFTEHIG